MDNVAAVDAWSKLKGDGWRHLSILCRGEQKVRRLWRTNKSAHFGQLKTWIDVFMQHAFQPQCATQARS
jgi:hypothetical protein